MRNSCMYKTSPEANSIGFKLRWAAISFVRRQCGQNAVSASPEPRARFMVCVLSAGSLLGTPRGSAPRTARA